MTIYPPKSAQRTKEEGGVVMRIAECFGNRVLPFTVNITRPEEREKLNQLGTEIAVKEGLRYEGYSVVTVEPYTLENAKATLYFD